MGKYFDYDDFYNNAWREVDMAFEGILVKRDMPELLNCKNEDEVREFAFDFADKKLDWFSGILGEDTEMAGLSAELKEKYMAKVRTHFAEGCILKWEIENEI